MCYFSGKRASDHCPKQLICDRLKSLGNVSAKSLSDFIDVYYDTISAKVTGFINLMKLQK